MNISVLTNDAQTDPLLLVASMYLLDSTVDFLVTLRYVFIDDLGLVIDPFNGRFLLDDDGVEIPEHLRELQQVTFDFQDLIMPGAHHLRNLLGIAASVALQKLWQTGKK